jgi:IS5 family transposase
MRKRFESQLKLGQTAIEDVDIPANSRDELPPVLSALQWIFTETNIRNQILDLLETKICGDKQVTGRRGMDLWHVFCLGIVRLSLDCNYDRLEYLVHYDILLRQIMGLGTDFGGMFGKCFHHRTISDNVSLIDEDVLAEVNTILLKSGRPLFQSKVGEPLAVKVDTYVLESNVHFPTDLNLLWDSCRKCTRLLRDLYDNYDIKGWRKWRDWEKKLKGQMRLCHRINKGGGANKQKRLERAVKKYLELAYDLEAKSNKCIEELKDTYLFVRDYVKLLEAEHFQDMLIKHIDLIERRLLKGEKIPHDEKIFSLFEPHTEWVNKGKLYPSVELGHKLLVATDQYGLILDYKVMEQTVDGKETLPLVDRLLKRYGEGSIGSISFDKGFSEQENRELLELYIPNVIMPKRGKLSLKDEEREGTKKFKSLRSQHNAIESDINCLEHHGLNRCPDKGLNGFKRYAGLGVLAYNLHKIGNCLLAKKNQIKKAA